MNTKTILNILLLLLFSSLTHFSQSNSKRVTELGNPFLRVYDPNEFNSAPMNWSIMQDDRGVMYFGNGAAEALQYDGSFWNGLEIPYNSVVRSYAKDSKGIIYICAYNDFGFLKPDSINQF